MKLHLTHLKKTNDFLFVFSFCGIGHDACVCVYVFSLDEMKKKQKKNTDMRKQYKKKTIR